MGAVRLGVMVVASTAIAAAASAQPKPSPGAPPHTLNIVRARVKPRVGGAYASLEGQIVRAYERAKVKVYWICLQSPREGRDILYLNLHESQESAVRAASLYQETLRQHPELGAMQQRLRDLTDGDASMLTTRRDDVDHPPLDVDFATVRTLRLTTFHVQPGREGDFLSAVRTTNAKEGSWLVYEANDTSTYVLMTLKRGPLGRHDGPPIPRPVRHLKGVYTKAETKTYTVRPAMSHVSQAFIAANPQLWRPAPAATH